MPFTDEKLARELQDFIPKCMEKRGDRYYPTDAGCRRLMEWLAEHGINAKVSIDDNWQFNVEAG